MDVFVIVEHHPGNRATVLDTAFPTMYTAVQGLATLIESKEFTSHLDNDTRKLEELKRIVTEGTAFPCGLDNGFSYEIRQVTLASKDDVFELNESDVMPRLKKRGFQFS